LEAKLRQLGAKIERFDPTPTE